MLNTFVSIAVAAETAASPAQQIPDPGMAALFFKLLISLVVIIVLIYLVLKFIKNQQGLYLKTKERQKGRIHIVDYQGLGTNKGIYLIEIINKTFAIAVSENSISTICELENHMEEKPVFTQSDDSIPQKAGTDFFELVRGFLNKIPFVKNSGGFQKELNTQLSFDLDEQRDRSHQILKKLTKGGADVE